MLKEKLKAALKSKGLNEGLADLIAIESEEQITDIVEQLSNAGGTPPSYEDVLGSEEFNAYIEENGFDKVLGLSKTLQKFHDQKVTKGIQTALKKSNPMPNDPKPTPAGGGEETPEWAKALLNKVEALEKEKSQQTFSNNVQNALKNSKLPDAVKAKWANRIVEGEVSIEDQVKELEGEYNEFYTASVASTSGRGLEVGGGASGEATDEAVDEIVEDLV